MIRKMICGLLVCVWVLTASFTFAECVDSCPDGTQEFEGFCYTESGGEITITDYAGSATDIDVPDEIDGLPVVNIGDQAFDSCADLTSVVIPDSVTAIGDLAFAECESLSSIVIPASVTAIGDMALYQCSQLSVAFFLGDAPDMGMDVFSGTADDFKVCYINGADGFTSPIWEGYTAEVCECIDDAGCDDGLYCTGVASCVENECVYSGNPCADNVDGTTVCDEDTNECVECLEPADCPDDGEFCTGDPVCIDRECGFAGDPCVADGLLCDSVTARCVECFEDGDCALGRICADGVCVKPVPECDTDEECGDRFCLNGVCVDCRTDFNCPDDGLFCTGEPVCINRECRLSGNPCIGIRLPFCDEARNRCVECLRNNDCTDGRVCEGGVCIVCKVDIRPSQIRSGFFLPSVRILTITGDPGFDGLDLGPLTVLRAIQVAETTLIVVVGVPALIPDGLIQVRVGNCRGTLRVRAALR